MTNRYVHAIWCDDIRQEIGNKPSLMGVYTAGITLPSLPIILPRLAAYISIITAKENPFKNLALKILRDDGFILATLQHELPDHDLSQTIQDDATKIFLTIVITLNGIEIPEGCKYFSILVDTESETLEGPKLWVTVNPDNFPVMPNNTP